MSNLSATHNPSSPTRNPISADAEGSYVDWGSIIGGVVLASAISVVMLTFGSAIGLSYSSASAATKGFAIGAGIGAALWFVWVQVSGFMAGAYLAGRLRRRKHDAIDHEVEVRDGSHGLLVWAGGVLVGTLLALSGLSSVTASIGSIVKPATESAAVATSGSGASAMQYYTDYLLRTPTQSTAGARTDRTAVTGEINTIMARSALSGPTDDDKTYLAQLVSQQTGAAPDASKKRVDDTFAKVDTAKAEMSKAAENARRVGIVAAFLLAASLLISAAAAYWAATLGGTHRDQAVEFTGFFKRN